MASVNAKILLDQSVTVAVSSECPSQLLAKDVNFIGVLEVSNTSSGSFSVDIEHSRDGVNWKTLISFTNSGANAVECITLDNTTNHVLQFVRANVAFTSGSADVKCFLCYDRV